MIIALKQAIDRLEDATPEYVDFVQDSVVSRFKILIESTWKDLGLFLYELGFTDIPGSPKGIVHLALEAKFISKEEHEEFLTCLNLRNLASHVYDKPQYLLAVAAAPGAFALTKKLYNRMVTKQLPLA